MGLVVGAKALGLDLRIIGISPSPRDDDQAALGLAALAAENAALLGLNLEFAPEDLESYGVFAGPAYGVMTDACREALQVMARNEGLVLDPTYTGKTAAGLIAHIRAGWWNAGQTVVFIHTGGTPALFAYSEELGLDF